MPVRRIAPVALLVVALVIASSGTALRAQTSNPNRQNELREQILEAGNQEAAALQELQAIRERKASIDARVGELDAEIRSVAMRLAPLEAEVARLTEQHNGAVATLAARQADLDDAKAEFDEETAKMYRSARRGATYDYVTAARPAELMRGLQYLDLVNERQQGVVRHMTVLRDEIEAQRKMLAESKAQADVAASKLQKLRDEIVGMRAEIEPARVQAAQQAAAEEAEIASVRSKKAEFEKEWAALQAVSDSIGAQLRNGGTVSGLAGACQANPAAGPIVSGFGYRTSPISGGTAFHAGVDIAASTGTPIRSCRAGTVVIAGWQGGYGNTVVIDHGGGMATLYAHQSRVGVSVGSTVGAGQVIGYVGSTGNSTGPHLHFEVRLSGSPVNPFPYI